MSKMKRILIIGGGQLGSRHLQGALKVSQPVKIYVLDKSDESLNLCRSRAEEVQLGNPLTEVLYIKSLNDIDSLEVCIIATGADVRYEVFKELVAQVPVNAIIFEKVLFQKENQYASTQEHLNKIGIAAWVNCPRRMHPLYQRLRDLLASEQFIEMSVTGENWGLACNGVHFLDLFSYMTGDSKLKIDVGSLDDNVEESKRKNFLEVYGDVFASDALGNKLSLSCSKGKELPNLVVRIKSCNYDVEICESGGSIKFSALGEEIPNTYQPKFQSELTQNYIESLITKGEIGLTEFEESAEIHVPFINAIQGHFERVLEHKVDACPIT